MSLRWSRGARIAVPTAAAAGLFLVLLLPAAEPTKLASTEAGQASFDHSLHLELGLSCDDCHDATREGRARLPSLGDCASCHEVDEATRSVDGKVLGDWSWVTHDEGIGFRHAPHAEVGADCAVCHQGIEASTRVTPDLAPSMDDCMSCHSSWNRVSDCLKCHTRAWKETSPASHRIEWLRRHGEQVRRGEELLPLAEKCSACHSQSHCVSCHQDQAPTSHTEQWRLRGHGPTWRSQNQESRAKAPRCKGRKEEWRLHAGTTPGARWRGPRA